MDFNRLLSDQQHGFRAKRSTTSQLLRVLDIWTEWLEEGKNFDVMYMDFAKAFDSVPHERLLKKIAAYGISGNLLKWTESFLKGRQQRVKVNSVTSEWKEVRSGIPQGSVLGPIFFIIYINDLPENMCIHVQMYADDTKIFGTVNNDAEGKVLQKDLLSALDWAKKWQLRFNVEKCKVMHYGSSNQQRQYRMVTEGGSWEMCTTSQEKDLGILFTPKMKFTEHIASAVNKANKITGIIRRSFKYMDCEMFTKLYKGLVRSHLESENKD